MEEVRTDDPWFNGLRSLAGEGGLLQEFKSAMEELADKLQPGTGSSKLKRAPCWTLDKKDIHNILSKFERLKSLVSFALHKNDL